MVGDADVERMVTMTLEFDAAGDDAVEHALDGEGERHEFRDGEPDQAGPGPGPHRAETFKLSTGALFVAKVRDIVGLHMAPPCDPSPDRQPQLVAE